uniref:Uncharacterized protein n=1 Tax=Rhizophora mucronata TaxID=61149 RepID=A0A2P2QT05_RHIMU
MSTCSQGITAKSSWRSAAPNLNHVKSADENSSSGGSCSGMSNSDSTIAISIIFKPPPVPSDQGRCYRHI